MPASPESVRLFNALPTPYVLLSPALVIEAVSEAFLHVTLMQREQLVGQYLFDVFPDNPQTPEANGMHTVHTSLLQVLATGQPHQLAQLHYDLPDPARPGHFLERYWQALTSPVLDAQGHVSQLLHATVDVTEQVQTQARLAESQVAEQQARAEADRQRQRFQEVLLQLPAHVAVYQGPDHVYEFVNPPYQRQFPHRAFLGRPLREAIPESTGLGLVALLDQVYQTGEPYHVHEMEGWFDFQGTGELEQLFLNLTLQPLRDAQGRIEGVLDFSYDVSEQVRSRRQVQQLNQELELRVTARTAEARAALHEAEAQREQARLQQALLGQILGQVPAAIATLSGPEHRFSFFNDQYQELAAGRTVLGHAVSDAFPEVAEQGIIDLLDQVYTTGQPITGTETALMLHDRATGQAEPRYLDFIYQPLFDGQQRLQGILAFAVDATARVHARKQAQTLQTAMLDVLTRQAQQRQDLFQIFKQAPAAIVLLREPNHRLDYFNPAFEQMFPPEEWTSPLLGQPIGEVYPHLQTAGLVALLDRVFRTGEGEIVTEMPLAVLQPGSPRHVTFTYQAYREQGRVVGVAAFVYDVSEQVRARQEREAQRQRLERLLQQAPAAICLLAGPELVFELVNPGYQQLFPNRALLGQPVLAALPEIAGGPVEAMLRGVYETGVTFEGQEVHMQFARAQDGRVEDRYFNFIYQARYDAVGRIDGLVVFAFEVSEQVRTRQQVLGLNEELRASNTRLTRTNTDLDTFVYAASHDLKAPIANIEGLLNALRDYLPTEAQEPMVPRLVGMMEGAIARFQQTVGHLTDVSYLQATQQPPPLEALDLAQVVEDVRLDLLPLLESTRAELIVAVEACPDVRFSTKNLRSVLFNLLSNALKYRHPDRAPAVQVRAQCTATQLVLTVQDNGLGLSEAQQGQLFTMFRRLHTHVEGSGVGLYLIKRTIENADGTIAVQSQPGVGSTFTVTLPRA